jgi:hypothetical protein
LRLFRTEGIKKTPVLKREELYQGLIEPGWGAGLLNPAQGGERNILYVTPLTLNSFLRQLDITLGQHALDSAAFPFLGQREAQKRCEVVAIVDFYASSA